MPTPVIIDGFDHRVASTAFFGTGPQGLWGAVSNAAGISFDTTNKRTGVAALKIAEDGVTATNISKAIPAGNRIIAVSVYFRVASAPSTGSRMMVVDGPTNKPQFRIGPDGRIGAAAAGGTTQWGPNVADDAWHRLDALVDVSGTTFTIDWQVDGTVQTQSAEAETSVDITYLRLGSGVATDTLTVWFDDLVASFTSADYPLGPHAVRFLVPNADGTHNNAANIMERASDGADIDGTTVTAWNLLDEWPPTTGTNSADTVTQANNGGTNYVEVQFGDITDSTVWGVEALAALQSDGTSANNGQTRIRDADGTETTVWSGGMNQTSPRYNRAIVTVPTGGWTQSHVNALLARIGYSTDANPDPEWLALALQVAVAESAGTQVPVTTATESDTALAPSGKQKVRVAGQSTGAEASLAFGRSKSRIAGVTSESDSSVALGRAKTWLLGIATESDVARPIPTPLSKAAEGDVSVPLGCVKSRAVALTAETEFSGALSRLKSRSLGIPQESGEALTLGRQKRVALVLATESNSAIALGRLKRQAISSADETNSALPVGHSKGAILSVATEESISVVLLRIKSRGLSVVTESDESGGTGRLKSLLVDVVSENDIALQVSRGGVAIALGGASETNSGLSLGKTKSYLLPLVASTDSAPFVVELKSRALGVTTESDEARPSDRIKSRNILEGSETDHSQLVLPLKKYLVTPAQELDTARVLLVARVFLLLPSLSFEESTPLARLKKSPIGTSTEISGALVLTLAGAPEIFLVVVDVLSEHYVHNLLVDDVRDMLTEHYVR